MQSKCSNNASQPKELFSSLHGDSLIITQCERFLLVCCLFVYGHLSDRSLFMQPTLLCFFFYGFYCNLAVYLNILLNWPLQVSEFVVRILRFLFGLPRHHSCSFHGWQSQPLLFHVSPNERIPFVHKRWGAFYPLHWFQQSPQAATLTTFTQYFSLEFLSWCSTITLYALRQNHL